MAANIVSAFITLLINIAAGVAIFFFVLLAMNGYHESDATYGIVVYIILAVLITMLMSAGAYFAAAFLIRRQFGLIVSALIAVSVFSIIGIVSKIVSGLIGIGMAELVRVNY